MSNQEAYEGMCEKAEKYDKLKEAVGKIKAEIGNKTHPNYTGHNEYEMAVSDGYSNALLIINKYTEGLI